MASCTLQWHPIKLTLKTLILLLMFCTCRALNFSFPQFDSNTRDIIFYGDAFSSTSGIQLTRNHVGDTLKRSVGRAVYAWPIPLYDPSTGGTASFSTHFEFFIKIYNKTNYGEGLAFFIAAVTSGSVIPRSSTGGYLGLFNKTTDGKTTNQIVAVEFDTFSNPWDPSPDHVGININTIESVETKLWPEGLKRGDMADAWIEYDGSSLLSVFLSYNGQRNRSPDLAHNIALKDFLPSMVAVGFTASTSDSTEIHNLRSWEFNISELPVARPVTPSPKPAIETLESRKRKDHKTVPLTVGLAVPLVVLGLIGFFFYRRRHYPGWALENVDVVIDGNFAYGPRQFTYRELVAATDGFSAMVGQGGFGGVFRGVLRDTKETVAVKRVSRGSHQGKKEYISEITIISRVRHRNLVRLVGWCHERGELLLVYENMINGSLDQHLFGDVRAALGWDVRYKIVCGLASAIMYLHEEWEQRVVHRDVKASNVMLDGDFNAKLGDFGLARLVDHGKQVSATTVVAGTMGYLAPECVMTGKASAESDVFSFGAVALETASGRRPIFGNEKEKTRLVDWVWDLYGRGMLLKAVDEKLEANFNKEEAKMLLTIGLWCSHPDPDARPKIRQVVRSLRLEAPLPRLPSKLPLPMYAPVMESSLLFESSTSTFVASSTRTPSLAWNSSSSSATTVSDKPLLNYNSNTL